MGPTRKTHNAGPPTDPGSKREYGSGLSRQAEAKKIVSLARSDHVIEPHEQCRRKGNEIPCMPGPTKPPTFSSVLQRDRAHVGETE